MRQIASRRNAGSVIGLYAQTAVLVWLSNTLASILRGTVLAENGEIGFLGQPENRIPIGAAEVGLDWDISRGTLRVPFKINSGSTRMTLRAEFAAPMNQSSPCE